MSSSRLWILLATLAGFGVAAWVLGAAGWHPVFEAVARLGPGGFVLYCLWSLVVFALLGTAWWAAAPREAPARIALFAWGRMVREGASDLLPFSHIGAIVLSVRTLLAHGVPAVTANAGLIVDMTTEMAAQLVFTLTGLGLFTVAITGSSHAGQLQPIVFGGTGVMIAAMVGFFLAQRHGLGLAARLAQRVLPGSGVMLSDVEAELARVYADKRAVGTSFAFNLLGWLGTATGAWLVLRLMDVPVSFWTMVMVESLIATVRSVAFAIPGALGVQELGYLLLAPLAGVAPEAFLALSLAKRARDLTLGLPTLVVWQLVEARAVLVARRG